mmetsp:Transcript_43997/g.99040  ORF Transcript_43997/g.99040 Transcript_43997/m.99040 type:complete len:241 (+) Transcript_43997:1441-2163(+)
MDPPQRVGSAAIDPPYRRLASSWRNPLNHHRNRILPPGGKYTSPRAELSVQLGSAQPRPQPQQPAAAPAPATPSPRRPQRFAGRPRQRELSWPPASRACPFLLRWRWDTTAKRGRSHRWIPRQIPGTCCGCAYHLPSRAVAPRCCSSGCSPSRQARRRSGGWPHSGGRPRAAASAGAVAPALAGPNPAQSYSSASASRGQNGRRYNPCRSGSGLWGRSSTACTCLQSGPPTLRTASQPGT